jgi:hypothetical protein
VWTDELVAWAVAECSASAVTVRSPGVDPAAVPEGPATFEGDPCRSHPILRMAVGDRTLTLRPVLDVFISGPVATAPAAVGESVTWSMGDVRLGQVGSQMVSPGDWIATTSITVGTPLTSLVVVARPDALAGTEVTLRVRSGALEIRSDARLLRDARVGDQVRVFVASTNRVVDGRLVDATTVER